MSLPTQYQQFIHLSRYARWNASEIRRETWPETVQRYCTFFGDYLEPRVDPEHKERFHDMLAKAFEGIVGLQTMPSMRALMTAGPALAKHHIAGYNCAFRDVNDIDAFHEIFFILMNGTGAGFRCCQKYVDQLPTVPRQFILSDYPIEVADSKEGWAIAYKELIERLYSGVTSSWDLSLVRPAGSVLKTFGGRASGPGPLEELFRFTTEAFIKAKGRKLQPIEVHDIVCKIGEVVVVGGVRRAALISLSDLNDPQMAKAKAGEWWEDNVQRALANNSIAFEGKPEVGTFMREWSTIYESKSGERGIFNVEAAKRQALSVGRTYDDDYGTNPCSEILLRSGQFCNLSEVVARREDTLVTLCDKVALATFLGTMQACLTDFMILGKQWKKNCDEERLLGVSITGIMDCPLLANSQTAGEALTTMREMARMVNEYWSKVFGINQAGAITCVKPSGTVSQLVDAASGIHSRHSDQYIRRVRGDLKDPMTQFMMDTDFPYAPDETQPQHTVVFDFPVKAPDNCITRDDRTALEELEHWLVFQRCWCDHKPSVTITVREHEWPEVGAWVYKHFDEVSGISFLPHSDHSYRQAPYEDCNAETLAELQTKMPKAVDWTEGLRKYEQADMTTASQELACTGNSCEIK